MLSHLSIKHLAVVEELELSFQAGMTIFTGETGAGKSILIDALGLTLGERAESSLVRAGAANAEVTAIYDISYLPRVKTWLSEQDLNLNTRAEEAAESNSITESNPSMECIIRRVITLDGKSRAYINGHAVPLNQLKELAEHLVNIHGQHQHQSLLRPEHQRFLLDEYGDHAALSAELREAYTEYQTYIRMQKELFSLQGQQDKLSLLQYQIQELEELNLKDDELIKIDEEQRKLHHASEWLGLCDSALNILQNEEGNHPAPLIASINQVNAIIAAIKLSSASLKNCRELFSQALIHLEEGSSELSTLRESISINPERLKEVEDRLSQIHNLARKHRVAPENLIEHQTKLKEEADKLWHVQTGLHEITLKIQAAEKAYYEIAKRLTSERQKTGAQLAKLVSEKMQTLEMPKGRFEVQLSEKTKGHLSPDGLDDIEFLVSTNPGLPMQALRKIASGGELSRLSLAIQVITAEKLTTPTLIFDEVDVGISGKTAAIVGKLMRQLGQKTQVLCVTHLPQVAVNGQQHYLVEKQQNQNTTITHIRQLQEEDKVMEIARLLGGTKITQNTLAHARELLEEI